MNHHQQYAANLVNRTSAADIFALAWTEPEETEEGTGRRRRRTTEGTEAEPTLRDLHDVVMLYGDTATAQRWGGLLAAAANLERRDGRPVTWALALAPLLAEVPEAEPETERTNGHLAEVA